MVKYGLVKTVLCPTTDFALFCNLTFICSPAFFIFTDWLEEHGWIVTKAKIHSSVYTNFFNDCSLVFEEFFFFFRKCFTPELETSSLSFTSIFWLYLKFFAGQIDIVGRGNMKTPAEGLSPTSCLCISKERASPVTTLCQYCFVIITVWSDNIVFSLQ